MTLSSSILGLVSMSITRYLRIDKNNTLSIFMLSGSIQFCIPFSFHINHAFIKIVPLIQYLCNVKDPYTNTLFNTVVSLFGL